MPAEKQLHRLRRLVLVGNSRLCLRGDEVMQVMVRPVQLLAGHAEGA